ncbi:hypothetical protein J421_2995 [Gemmatirosa kalamazoonensis]|uniref:Uncharacterized protein n=1 Tax=Gemmatirosa kalamazoonensis TaxID=861299 RepID=W0RJC4_9BACT|nr:hypothetical protein [Gemmatirosa kalamazoonensis]AHG90532.1 hypothetical protein J421_2995 [Gemmatirosa kalamazoonensis]
MSDRQKPHNGRDRSGHFKVRQEDFEDKLADPNGPEFIADDVRLGGAVEDVGLEGGRRADELQREIDVNREVTERFRRPDAGPTGQR